MHTPHIPIRSIHVFAPATHTSTKQGEALLKEVFPSATIVRPGRLFGPEDRLLNWYAFVSVCVWECMCADVYLGRLL